MEKLITFKAVRLLFDVDIQDCPVEVYDKKSGMVIRGKCAEIHLHNNSGIKRLVLSGIIVWNHSKKKWVPREAQLGRKSSIRTSFNFSYDHEGFMEGPFITKTEEITFACLHELDQRHVAFFPRKCRLPKRPCAYRKHQNSRHLTTIDTDSTPRHS